MEMGNLPEKEFRIMIVKMIQDLGKRMEAKMKKMQEMFNKDLEELKNKQTEMTNPIDEIFPYKISSISVHLNQGMRSHTLP